jgi:hypothetical protein
MRHRLAVVALAAFAVGCTDSPIEPSAARVFSGIGAYDVEQWMDPSVPGSGEARSGTSLPIYFVCPVDGDSSARAAAILTNAELRLFANGTAEIQLAVGTWASANGGVTASSEIITRWGNWSEEDPNAIELSGFGIPGLGARLAHTELGHAELPITLACPSAASVTNVQPTLSWSLNQ